MVMKAKKTLLSTGLRRTPADEHLMTMRRQKKLGVLLVSSRGRCQGLYAEVCPILVHSGLLSLSAARARLDG